MPMRKSKDKVKYGKAPQAPKRFKSAYMFFSTVKHPEIRARLGHNGAKEKTTAIAKLVSIEWKRLSQEERAIWEEKARQDKIRFEKEKNAYSGPWKVEIKKKVPSMPTPPGSAFLDFANRNRSNVQTCNPRLKSKEIRSILAHMWKEAGDEDEERNSCMDREKYRWENYETSIKAYWSERAGGEDVVAEQVPEPEMRAEETDLLDPAATDNHPEEEPVQQHNVALAQEDAACTAFDHLLDAYFMNNAVQHATKNWEPNLEAEVGTIREEVINPLLLVSKQNYSLQHQHQQGTFPPFHEPDNDKMKRATDHMNCEPNTVFYHKYTAGAQFGSFGLHSESSASAAGLLKNDDHEMRQLYLDLAALVC